MNRSRILIADDHEFLRRGLRATLEEDSRWEVIGEAGTGRDAVKLSQELAPDLVVLDITMPELNGLDAARQIRAAAPDTRVLILSVHHSEQLIRDVLRSGAHGFLFKSDAGRELVNAVESILAGEPYFSPAITQLLVDDIISRRVKPSTGGAELTSREREIAQLIAEGSSTRKIAEQLGLSPKTVETHRANLMTKLKLDSVADLVRWAVRTGLIEV